MTIADMVSVLHARVLCGEERLATPVYTACCSDLMSDVLAFVNEKTVLITGLTNHHVLRTADMLDLKCLVFARGKVPGELKTRSGRVFRLLRPLCMELPFKLSLHEKFASSDTFST